MKLWSLCLLALALAASTPATPVRAQSDSDSSPADSSSSDSSPSAEDDEAARQHFQAGLAFYEDGHFEEALPEFEAAWELSHRPEMLINIANAAERGLDYARAVSALENYLEFVPDAENVDALTRRISRDRTAAERLAAGEDSGQSEADSNSNSNSNSDPGSGPDSGPGSTVRLAGWLTIGGAGALGVASLITGLVSHGTHSDLQEVCTPVCPSDRAGDIDRGRSLATASTVLSAVALAAGIAGVVLVIVGRDGDEGETETAVVEVLPGLTGASVRVRY